MLPILRSAPRESAVGAVAAEKVSVRYGRVGEPSNVGSVARAVKAVRPYKTEIKEKASKCGHPEAGTHSGGGRLQVCASSAEQIIARTPGRRWAWRRRNHRGPMHREHPVDDLGRNKMVLWDDELKSHDRRFRSPNQQEHQRVQNVHDAQRQVDRRRRDPRVKPAYKGWRRELNWQCCVVNASRHRSGSVIGYRASCRQLPSAGILHPGFKAAGFRIHSRRLISGSVRASGVRSSARTLVRVWQRGRLSSRKSAARRSQCRAGVRQTLFLNPAGELIRVWK